MKKKGYPRYIWHGHARGYVTSLTYNSWSGMVQRCTNPNNPRWPEYGGRGIKVCKRWLKFENFLADMGEKPRGHQLDRINNGGHYYQSNCQWSTRLQQANNKRNNVYLTFKGARLSLSQWALRIGISQPTLWRRIKAGWPVARALESDPNAYKGASHPNAKITEADAKIIKYGGLSNSEAARRFGISPQNVCSIQKGRAWKHL